MGVMKSGMTPTNWSVRYAMEGKKKKWSAVDDREEVDLHSTFDSILVKFFTFWFSICNIFITHQPFFLKKNLPLNSISFLVLLP